MARINVPTNIIDSAMLKAAMDIQQQKADSISSQYKNYLSSIKDLTGTFKDLGSAYDEYRGEKTREEQASDFMEKYKDDPMAKAAAYNFISGKDTNAIQKFIDDKTKRDEMEANKQKTINGLKGQIETSLRRVEAAGSRDEAKKYLYAAQDVADTLANQYGIQVDIPDTLDGNQYAWQQKEAEEKEAEEEKAGEEYLAGIEKAAAEERKQQDEEEKANLKREIAKYNRDYDSAEKIQNPEKRRKEFAELADRAKSLEKMVDIYGISDFPKKVREEQYAKGPTEKEVAKANLDKAKRALAIVQARYNSSRGNYMALSEPEKVQAKNDKAAVYQNYMDDKNALEKAQKAVQDAEAEYNRLGGK